MTPTPHSRRDVLKGAVAIAAAASVGPTSARRATAQGSAKAQIDGVRNQMALFAGHGTRELRALHVNGVGPDPRVGRVGGPTESFGRCRALRGPMAVRTPLGGGRGRFQTGE